MHARETRSVREAHPYVRYGEHRSAETGPFMRWQAALGSGLAVKQRNRGRTAFSTFIPRKDVFPLFIETIWRKRSAEGEPRESNEDDGGVDNG